MKKLILVTFLFGITINLFSQKNCDVNTSVAQNAQFFFNSFLKGTVVFKDNTKTDAILNYNIISDDIYYIDGEKFYTLNSEDVKYILICDYRFYFYNGNVLELVYSKDIQLLVERKVNLEDLYDKKGAYGATSPNTVGVDLQYADVVTQTESSNYMVNLRKKGDKELDVKYTYKIKNGNKFLPATKKSFFKIYKEHKESIEKYLGEGKFDFDNKKDLIEIANYCKTL